MTTKEQLKTIFSILGVNIDVEQYDFEQGDDDESQSGGVWDLSFDLADILLDNIYTIAPDNEKEIDQTRERLQETLYNLIK